MPPPRPSATPEPSPLRRAVERRSRVLLVYLSHRPSWTLPLVTGVLLIAGLFLPPVAGVPVLVVVLVLVGWLSYLSWPVVHGIGRPLRLAMVVLLLVAIGQRLA